MSSLVLLFDVIGYEGVCWLLIVEKSKDEFHRGPKMV